LQFCILFYLTFRSNFILTRRCVGFRLRAPGRCADAGSVVCRHFPAFFVGGGGKKTNFTGRKTIFAGRKPIFAAGICSKKTRGRFAVRKLFRKFAVKSILFQLSPPFL